MVRFKCVADMNTVMYGNPAHIFYTSGNFLSKSCLPLLTLLSQMHYRWCFYHPPPIRTSSWVSDETHKWQLCQENMFLSDIWLCLFPVACVFSDNTRDFGDILMFGSPWILMYSNLGLTSFKLLSVWEISYLHHVRSCRAVYRMPLLHGLSNRRLNVLA